MEEIWRGEEPSVPWKVLPARAIDGVGRMALMAASATFHDGGADIAAFTSTSSLLSPCQSVSSGWLWLFTLPCSRSSRAWRELALREARRDQ